MFKYKVLYNRRSLISLGLSKLIAVIKLNITQYVGISTIHTKKKLSVIDNHTIPVISMLSFWKLATYVIFMAISRMHVVVNSSFIHLDNNLFGHYHLFLLHSGMINLCLSHVDGNIAILLLQLPCV